MKTMIVPMIMTGEDKARAKAVAIAEAQARGIKTPDFMRDGLGACARQGDPDDFVNDETRTLAAAAARARAAAVCAVCPFTADCLRRGMETHETGVYGGVFLRGGHAYEKKAKAA